MGTVLFLLFSFLAFPQAELPTIEIHANTDVISKPRSIEWPSINSELPNIINLPLPDDSLNGLNGLQMKSQGSPTYAIRGSALSGRTLVLYNDIPLNFAAGLGTPLLFLPKEMVSQVQIIKGPASLFYGSQAMSGAVNFQPRQYQHFNATSTISDTDDSLTKGNGLAHNNFQVAGPVVQTKRTHVQASFFTEKDDGQYPYQSPRGDGQRFFNAQNTNRVVLSGKNSGKNANLSFDAIVGRQIRQSPGPIHFPTFTREHSEGILASLSPEVFFNDNSFIKSRLSYLSIQSDYQETNLNSKNNQETFIAQNEWHYDFNAKSQLQVFLDFFSHKLDNTFSGDGLKENRFEVSPIYSFYSLQNLKHQLGARYLNNSKKLLPSLSTKIYFGPHESWLSYSEGFRSPGLSDLYSKSPFFVGNPNLLPERSKQWELGFLKKGRAFSLDLRLFHIDYQELMDSYEVTPGLYSKQNQGAGFSRGFDIEARWFFTKMQNYVRYNFLETKNYKTDNPFRFSPKHQVSLGVNYRLTSWFNLDLQNIQWYKFYDMANNQLIPLENWSQWNLLANATVTNNLKISFGLINALNEAKELTLYYPEPQKKYWLQVSYEFR